MKNKKLSLLGIGWVVGTFNWGGLLFGQETMKITDDAQVKPNETTTLHFDLKEIPKGQQVRLFLDARIEAASLGGNAPVMDVKVNENQVLPRDLINKPLDFIMRDGTEMSWGFGTDFRVCYSPDFSDRIKTEVTYEYGIPDTDPWRFGWDVTMYAHRGANVVNIQSSYGTTLKLRHVCVETGPSVPSKNITSKVLPSPTGPLPVYAVKKRMAAPMKVEVARSGDIRLKVMSHKFEIHSRTSQPEGEWSHSGEKQNVWNELDAGKSITAKWSGADYTVEREVTLNDDHISVKDTFHNTGNDLMGIIYENRLELKQAPRKVLLCGFPGVGAEVKKRSMPNHPTAMAQLDDLTIGLVAEDDIFRIHCKSFEEAGVIGLADARLGMGPGKSHALEWSIYPVPNGDYWDFINAIRRNWGSNMTLQGPLAAYGINDGDKTGPQTAEYYRKWLKNKGLKILLIANSIQRIDPKTATPDNPFWAHGTALLMCKEWCDDVRNLVKKVKEVDPTIRAFAYTQSNLCTEPGCEKKYPDSLVLNEEGKPITTSYGYPIYQFVPTLENSYGKALRKTYEYIVENLDANIYNDEITYCGVPQFIDCKAWDGCTAIINPSTHEVEGQQSSAFLLMQPWRASLMEYLKSKGKTLIGNGPFFTRTMLNWKIQTFVESQSYSSIVGTHLSTPWAAGNHYACQEPDNNALRVEVARRCLDYGGVYTPYLIEEEPSELNFASYMYPITPMELHPGVVIGEERILTNRSGAFGWGDDSRAEVYVFDGSGKRVEKPDVKEMRQGGQVLTELRMPGDHLAILVRNRKSNSKI